MTFDREALPPQQVISWFKAPGQEGEEYACGSDGAGFSLGDLKGMNVPSATAERGHEYYAENKVRYLCVDKTRGYAIVEGSKVYEVEFEYRNGQIGGLISSCFCSGGCKHEFAAMLQLKETLELIGKHYQEPYEKADYFAAILKGTLFGFAIDSRETGGFTL